jgi:hypothetical protein
VLVMDLEDTEVRNDCAAEIEQQFNRPTVFKELVFTVITHTEVKLNESP